MSDKPDLQEITKFNKGSLKKTETQEKDKSKEGYAQEKTLKEVSNYAQDKMKHVETQEKNALPTQADIEAEKNSGF